MTCGLGCASYLYFVWVRNTDLDALTRGVGVNVTREAPVRGNFGISSKTAHTNLTNKYKQIETKRERDKEREKEKERQNGEIGLLIYRYG